VEARSKEAKAMTDYMNELVKLWDDALIEASRSESKPSGKTKASYAGRNLYKDSSVYDYDFMVSQPDMVVHELPPLDVVKTGTKIDHKKVVELGLANAEKIGRRENGEVYAVKNAYTQKEIMVGTHGLNHGLDGNNIGRIITNARLSAIGGYIVQNAIPINGRKNKNRQANGTYAMACLVKSGDVDVVAIVTVEEHTSKAVEIDYVDVTHSIGGRLRKNKESSQSSTREKGYGLKAAPNEATFTISLADFLDIVNETHKSILSEDVLKHFGETRPENGVFTGDVLFSRRDSSEGLTKEDARAQAQAYTQLKAENAALQRRLVYWRGQT